MKPPESVSVWVGFLKHPCVECFVYEVVSKHSGLFHFKDSFVKHPWVFCFGTGVSKHPWKCSIWGWF